MKRDKLNNLRILKEKNNKKKHSDETYEILKTACEKSIDDIFKDLEEEKITPREAMIFSQDTAALFRHLMENREELVSRGTVKFEKYNKE